MTGVALPPPVVAAPYPIGVVLAGGITQSVGSAAPGTGAVPGVVLPGGGVTGGTVPVGGVVPAPVPLPFTPVTGGGPSPPELPDGVFDEPFAPGAGKLGIALGREPGGAMPLIAAPPPFGVAAPSSLPHATSTVADVRSPRISRAKVVFTTLHAVGAPSHLEIVATGLPG